MKLHAVEARLLMSVVVSGNGVIIEDGDLTPAVIDATQFGIIAQGTMPRSHTYLVRNTGAGTLTMSGLAVPAGFTVTESLVTSLAPGASDEFTVTLSAAAVGERSGQISFTNSDPLKNPFNFAIAGSVAVLPEVTLLGNGVVIIDGDVTPSPDDFTDFGGAAVGGAPIASTFTVRNDGGATLSLLLNSIPSGFRLATPLPEHILPGQQGTFTLELDTTVAGVFAGDFRFAANDIDEGAFNFRVIGRVGPEVTVTGNNVNIADGDGSPSAADFTSFVPVVQGTAPTMRVFKVQNDGGVPLTLSGLTVPAGFSILDGLSASLGPGESDTFTVQLDSGAVGSKSGQISFITNDGDENPFNFAVNGTVAAAVPSLGLASLLPANGGDGSMGITLFGVDFSDALGSVSSAGDMNGDGFDDLLIGVRNADGAANAKYAAGDSYVVFGRPSFADRVTIDLATLDGVNGFTLQGVDASDFSGQVVSGGGDVNGDGFDDIIIGAQGGDAAGNAKIGAGESYVIFGKASFASTPAISLASLDGVIGFTLFGLDGNDLSGQAVAIAGDLNDDGFDDIAIGAGNADGAGNALSNSGEVYVVFGRSSFAATPFFDLASLNGANGFTLRGADQSDRAGNAVARAGDVNGDGIDDLIVGAYEADAINNAKSYAGEAYVIFGKASFAATPVIGLGGLSGADGFALIGVDAGDRSGSSVSAAGDVNGDGFGDVIVSARTSNGAGNTLDRAGEAYVVFGKASFVATPTIELAGLNGSNGFAMFGAAVINYAGQSASGAGDVDGDGFDDLLVGARGVESEPGNFRAGNSYLIYGKPSFPASMTLNSATLDRSTGFAYVGIDGNDEAGTRVAGAGDVNGDGLADFIFSAPGGDALPPPAINSNTGEAYVIFGKARTPEVTLLGNNTSILDGDTSPALADFSDFGFVHQGRVVSRTFTVRNDGAAQLTLSGLTVSAGFAITESLASSLAPGASDSFSVQVDTSALGAVVGTLTFTTNDADESFFNVSLAATVALFPDIAVTGNSLEIMNDDFFTTPGEFTHFGDVTAGGPGLSRTFIVRNDGSAPLQISSVTVPDHFSLIEGLPATLAAGASDSFTVRLNATVVGFKGNMIEIVSNDSDESLFRFAVAGRVVPPSVQLRSLLPANGGDGNTGVILYGGDSSDGSGRSVSGAGDVNGDGFDDFIIGAPDGDGPSNSRVSAGETYIVFGRAGFAGVPSIDLTTLNGTDGFKLYGVEGSPNTDRSGISVGGGGDVNGDGFDDLIISGFRADGPGNTRNYAGDSYIVFGKASFAATPAIELSSLNGVTGVTIYGIDALDFSGWALAGAGDVNGDGFDDVIIGTLGADGAGNAKSYAGESYIVFGRASFASTPTIDLGLLDGLNGITLFGIDAQDRSGRAVASAGDVNGDGFDDVIIGASYANSLNNTRSRAGESYIVFGKASFAGAPTLDLATLNGANGFRVLGATMSDGSGISVSGAGDVNGDGFDDVVIGAYRADGPGTDDEGGAAYVIFGKASFIGVSSIDLATLGVNDGLILRGADPLDRTGRAVAGAGDFNGDGLDDLLIGAYRGRGADNFSHAGDTYVVYGRSDWGSSPIVDLRTISVVTGLIFYGIDQSDESGIAVSSAGDVNNDGFADLLIAAPSADGIGNAKDLAGETYLIFGKPVTWPQASVEGAGVMIADGDATPSAADDTDFGRVVLGAAPIARTFTVRNDGTATMNLLGLLLPDGFSLVEGLAGALAPEASDTFTVRLDSAALGAKLGDIVLYTDDPAESVFNFAVTGSVVLVQDVTVLGAGINIADGDATPAAIDQTDFGIIPLSGAPVSRTFAVRNDGATTLNLSAVAVPTGFTVTEGLSPTLAPGASDTFTVQLTSASLGVKTGEISFTTNNPAENPFNFAITGTVAPLPEVTVLGNSMAIADGTSVPLSANGTDFGNPLTGSPGVARTFTVHNDGAATLNLSGLTLPAGYTLVEGLSPTIAPGGSDTFSVRLETGTRGVKSGSISFLTDDLDESPFNFAITGNVMAPLVDLNALLPASGGDGTQGVTIFGAGAGDLSGGSVAGAGDVNGDGIDDVIIGAIRGDGPNNTRNDAGESYVVFGRPGFAGVPTIDLATLDGVNGFTLFGIDNQDYAGTSVSGAGDVNGDGFDDIIIGARFADGTANGKFNSGETYVVFGRASFAATPTIDLASLNGSNGFTLIGVDTNDNSGNAVSAAGDVNGDGFDDLIVGAYRSSGLNNANGDAGESYVVFGKASFAATPVVSLALDGATGFTMLGGVRGASSNGDFSGTSVAGAGDVNGDGFDDVVISASNAAGPLDSRFSSGESYIVFGKSNFQATPVIRLDMLDGTNGVTLFGVDIDDSSGSDVAGAGDVNGDGFDDVIIGAVRADGLGNFRDRSGDTYILFGKASFAGTPAIELATLNGQSGITLHGVDNVDLSGRTVAGAGDVNGDGFDDVLIAAYNGRGISHSKTYSGETYVIFGRADFSGSPVIDLFHLNVSTGFTVFGADEFDKSGSAVAGAGDVNGDGIDDLIIGAFNADAAGNAKANAGESYVLFGKAVGADGDAPTVQSVLVGSSAWQAGFPLIDGYAIPTGASQLLTLPWINLNQIRVIFSEDVSVVQDDLVLRGINVGDYSVTGFAYDAVTFTATWTLSNFIGIDKLLVTLDDTVADHAGNALDGEWLSGGDSFPSGDSAEGGRFEFRFNVLPGDVTQDGAVLGSDVIIVRNSQFQIPGSAGYSVLRDVNGSNSILGNDLISVRNAQFTSLPSGEPTVQPILQLSAEAVESSALTEVRAMTTVDADSNRKVAEVVSVLATTRATLAPVPGQVARPSRVPSIVLSSDEPVRFVPVLELLRVADNAKSKVRNIVGIVRQNQISDMNGSRTHSALLPIT